MRVKILKGLTTAAMMAVIATSAQADASVQDSNGYNSTVAEAISKSDDIKTLKFGIEKSFTKSESFGGYAHASFNDFQGFFSYNKFSKKTSIFNYQVLSKILDNKYYSLGVGFGVDDEKYTFNHQNKNKILGIGAANLSVLNLLDINFYINDASNFGTNISTDLYRIPTNDGIINFKIYSDIYKINSYAYNNVGAAIELSY